MQIVAALLLLLSPLKEAELALQAVPECRPVLEQVSRQGGFTLIPRSNTQFEAQWDSYTRTIEVNTDKHATFGDLITSVLFELHNASKDNEIRRLYERASRRLITKEEYVRQIEEIEWKNWQATCELLDAGRAQGIFPKEAILPPFSSFPEYLHIQHQVGHSQYHAHSYDLL